MDRRFSMVHQLQNVQGFVFLTPEGSVLFQASIVQTNRHLS